MSLKQVARYITPVAIGAPETRAVEIGIARQDALSAAIAGFERILGARAEGGGILVKINAYQRFQANSSKIHKTCD